MARPHTPKQHTRFQLARSLKLAQIEAFVAIVEAGSILAASRELALTQSAVSKSIQDLERQLDAPLFVRGKRGVVLTELGTEFERHARRMLAELRYLANDLNAWHSGEAGHVTVGTLVTASATLLPAAITRLRRAAPRITVEVRMGTNATLFPALSRGDLDVVVGFLPNRPVPGLRSEGAARLIHHKLHDETLCVVVDKRQPLARKRRVTLTELQSMDWILPTQDSVAFEAAAELFSAQGLAMPLRVVHSVSALTNVGLLTRSLMVALMPRSAAEQFAQAGLLSILPIGPLGVAGAVGYTLRGDREPSVALMRFVECLDAADTQQGQRQNPPYASGENTFSMLVSNTLAMAKAKGRLGS